MTTPRFLIDENLSPKLVAAARQRGFEAMHVNHLGLRTESDWELLKVVADEDWTLVTNNAIEFRRRYERVGIHAGVVFIMPAVRGARQLTLFEAALAHVLPGRDLVNRALDVAFDDQGHPCVTIYDLP